MRRRHSGFSALLFALGTVSAAEPPNMQQASPIALAADGKALATRVVRLDPSLDRIIAPNAQVTVVKGENYFGVIEGGAWVPGTPGYLLFTDFVANVIYQLAPATGQLSIFLNKSGYTGNLADYTGRITTTQYGAPLYVYDWILRAGSCCVHTATGRWSAWNRTVRGPCSPRATRAFVSSIPTRWPSPPTAPST
jgi:hypothetical protein